jgi:hypothetical protein
MEKEENIGQPDQHSVVSTDISPLPEANPPHGQKGEFIRFTCTLNKLVYRRLADEATRRKMEKEPNPIISAIIRDALASYLKMTDETAVSANIVPQTEADEPASEI